MSSICVTSFSTIRLQNIWFVSGVIFMQYYFLLIHIFTGTNRVLSPLYPSGNQSDENMTNRIKSDETLLRQSGEVVEN